MRFREAAGVLVTLWMAACSSDSAESGPTDGTGRVSAGRTDSGAAQRVDARAATGVDPGGRPCHQVAAAFARSWERCARGDYESTYELFVLTLDCNGQLSSGQGDVTACVADLDAQECSMVSSNVTPSSCYDVLG